MKYKVWFILIFLCVLWLALSSLSKSFAASSGENPASDLSDPEVTRQPVASAQGNLSGIVASDPQLTWWRYGYDPELPDEAAHDEKSKEANQTASNGENPASDLSGPEVSLQSIPSAQDGFSMIIASDPQLTWWRQQNDPELPNDAAHREASKEALQNWVDAMNNIMALGQWPDPCLRPDCRLAGNVPGSPIIAPSGVIINGDLTEHWHSWQFDLFESYYTQLEHQLYPGLGDHDYKKNVDDATYAWYFWPDDSRAAKEAVWWMANQIDNEIPNIVNKDLNGYVALRNDMVLKARLNVEYTLNDNSYSWTSGEILPTYGGVKSIPSGATDIVVKVQRWKIIGQEWVTVRTYAPFSSSRAACYKTYFSVLDAEYSSQKIDCPYERPPGSYGSLAYSFDIENYHFVQVQNNPSYDKVLEGRSLLPHAAPWNMDAFNPTYSPSFNVTESFDWFREDLVAATENQKYIVINTHHYFGGWQDIITNTNVVAIFWGHKHPYYGEVDPPLNNGSYDIPIFHSGAAECLRFLLVEFNRTHFNVGVVNASGGQPVFIQDEADVCDTRDLGFGGSGNFRYDNNPDNPTPVTFDIPSTFIFNRPPSVGGILETTPANEGAELSFQATSTDPDGDTITHTWSFGDSDTGTGETPKHIYQDDGTYIVTVTGDDGYNGGTANYILKVTVDNVAPTADFNAPATLDEGNDFTLSLTNIFDPSPIDTATGFESAFDCGDGSYGNFSHNVTQTSCYAGNNSLFVRAKIRDVDGGTTEYAVSVIVNENAPLAFPDEYHTPRNTTLDVALPGVLANDHDVDPLTVITYTLPAVGTLNKIQYGDGAFAYEPPLDFVGTTSFTYHANDGDQNSNEALVTIIVYNGNAAPVLDTATMELTDINEDDTTSAGTLVSDIIASAGGDPITDPDGGAVEGIAVYALGVLASGDWQYSLNGGTDWYSFGSPSLSAARLLGSDAFTRIRFVPDVNWPNLLPEGLATLALVAWDRTSGVNGGTADINSRGGSTAFSNALTTKAYVTVKAINDAPFVEGSADLSVDEDTDISLDAQITDWDIASGLISVTLSADHGTLSGEATITFSRTITNTNSFLFGQVFSPTLDYNGQAKVEFFVDDQGYTGAGGPRSGYFKTDITVNPVNDAPVLDNSGYMALDPINQDETDSSGTLVSDLITSSGGDPITDVDADALEGIAVMTADNTNGVWQYSVISTTTWLPFGSPSAGAARLLAADEDTRIRFVPTASYTGMINPSLTFRAWDQTGGINGGAMSTTPNGETTPFSTFTETTGIIVQVAADLVVTQQNEPEFVVPGQETITQTVVVGNYGPSDISGAVLTVNLSANLVNPTWNCTADGGATCGGSGSGNITDTLDLPFNGVVSYTISGAVATSALGLTSLAEVNNPELEIDPDNNWVIIEPIVIIEYHSVYLPIIIKD